MTEFRIEKDSMGEMKVPQDVYYGAQTARAVDNFPISQSRMPRAMIRAMGEIKRAAAIVNAELGKVDAKHADAIVKAADHVIAGKGDAQFVVDIFQTGSGTSTNMNTNEVIANRAIEILGETRGTKSVHPNDHVNYGQSSNDVFPTAMHLATIEAIHDHLLVALKGLHASLDRKSKEFDGIVKIGRTHLQDATPIRLGQVFSGYAAQVADSIRRLERSSTELHALALGGTAVGTGINTSSKFIRKVIETLAKRYGHPLHEAENHFAAQGGKDALVDVSGALRATAVALTKVANDVRWLASGPRCGIGEIKLPATQPGSSIMPAKVNPVIAESLLMVCAQVVGNDATVALCGQSGNFELNVMMPVMIHNVLESCALLASASANFQKRCVDGIEADEARCKDLIEQSLAMCTVLAPKIGYDQAAQIAKEAYQGGKTVRQIATERKILPKDELDELLEPINQTRPEQN